MTDTVNLKISRKLFEGLLQQEFQVHRDDESSLTLKLEKVSSMPVPSNKYESFSLTFSGPPSPALVQATFQVEHETLGRFSLFLVPVAADEKGYDYEAVFNLPIA